MSCYLDYEIAMSSADYQEQIDTALTEGLVAFDICLPDDYEQAMADFAILTAHLKKLHVGHLMGACDPAISEGQGKSAVRLVEEGGKDCVQSANLLTPSDPSFQHCVVFWCSVGLSKEAMDQHNEER